MPRRIFPASSVTNTTGAPIRLSFHYTQAGGQRATDLWTVDGSNYASAGIPNGTVLTDASGNYSAFAGPDDVDTLWVAPHTGATRTQITATGTVANGTTVDSSTYAQLLPAASSYTYNADGTVATETVAGITSTYTYNADGSVNTMTRSGVTRTFTYNTDGTIATVA